MAGIITSRSTTTRGVRHPRLSDVITHFSAPSTLVRPNEMVTHPTELLAKVRQPSVAYNRDQCAHWQAVGRPSSYDPTAAVTKPFKVAEVSAKAIINRRDTPISEFAACNNPSGNFNIAFRSEPADSVFSR
jgi:hypothetical protein